MTVSSQDTVFQYVGNGVTTTFAYSCQVPTATDLQVFLNDLEQTSGFSITGLGSLTGGTVIFSAAPANSVAVRIERVIELERATDYQQNGDFLVDVVNPDFDRLWMALQQYRSGINRALVVPNSDTVLPNPLPAAAQRANNLLGFDANGQPVVVAPAAQSATALQILLAAPGGSALIGSLLAGAGAVPRTVQDQLREYVTRSGYDSDANFNAAKAGKLSMDGTGRARAPLIIIGTEEISGPTLRDAAVVGRNLVGDTNCHGFADRTIISGVTDAGLYGSFDCTVELQGTHNQNHVYSYQDRVRYSGGVGGILQNSCGFLSQTIHSGAGTIQNRNGVQIDPMAVTAGGTIDAQTGVRINHLGSATNNVALFIGQTTAATGWAIYAPGSTANVYPLNGAKSFLAGEVGFGLEPTPGLPITWKTNTSSSNKTGFLGSDATRTTVGAIGDTQLAFVTNAQARILLDGSAGSYGLKPNADNGQPLGGAAFRWSVVYAGTGTINTSDAREKQQARSLLAQEKAVALKVKAGLKAFKFNDAVAGKGEAARWHFGVYAQEVADAFASEGLDATKYAMFCYDEWPDEYETWEDEFVEIPAVFSTVVLEDGTLIELEPARRELVRVAGRRLLVAGGNRYGIRYDELLSFLISVL